MRCFVIVAAAVLVGCGDEPPAAPPDAFVPGPCWPEDLERKPRGSAVLGTGRETFQAMPDVLPLEYGTQDGFMLIANVRMTGFEPGNPKDILDPRNPRTRIRAYFADTNVPLNYSAHCPFRAAYVDVGGELQMVEAAAIVFETCWRSDRLFGQRIRIELELLDRDGGYTTDVKTVTAAPPEGFHPIDMNSPPCTPPR